MKNAYAISSLAQQLGKVGEKISSLAMGAQDAEQAAPELGDVYQGMLFDEIEHVQILALELTKLVMQASEEANTDEGGSVFAAGDLTAEKAGEGDSDDGQSKENK